MRFPRITVDFTLEKTVRCSTCPCVVQPFSKIYAVEILGKSFSRIQCEMCIRAEMEMRISVGREKHAMRMKNIADEAEANAE